MVFKKLFGGGKEKVERELDVDDLIVLERYEEAADRLRERVRTHPTDLHSHLKLAGVYFAQGQSARAVDEFVFVADEYADDGFYDKGTALLAKALKMAPGDASIVERLDRLEKLKRMEHSRTFAIEGLLRKSTQGDDSVAQGMTVIDAQMLWAQLQETSLVQRFAPEQLKRLLGAMDLLRIPARELLEEQGSTHEALYLLVDGAVEAAMEHRGGLSMLRTFSVGDFIGETALFERKPWPTHYRAVEASTLLMLDRAGLEQVLHGNSDPRALIDELRAQHHDQSVREALAKLALRS